MPVIKVRSPKTDRTVEFERDFDASEEVKESMFQAMAVIKCQGAARKVLDDKDKTLDDAIAAGMSFVPGVVTKRVGVKKDPFKVIKDQIDSGVLTREDAKKKIRELLGA